jgi:putative SOS response-associated peptidase YedK
MRWGLVPAWAKQDAAGFINARAETAATNPAVRAAWRSRRCLIPATGFYEWQTVGKSKRPFHFTLLNDPIFCIAGLWEPPAGRACVPTCAILTVPANPLVAEYHDRMPAILRPDAYDAWLDGPLPDPACLGAFPAEEMSAARASERVNSPRNDAPDLLEPERGLF